ncbi:MAG: radical SAM protein [Thermoplasmataceae archaeon]
METVQAYRYRYWEETLRNDPLISPKECGRLMEDLSLYDLMTLANSLTTAQVGDVVSYAISYNINYSNYCAASCPICAFYVPAKLRGKTDRGYELSLEDVRKEMQKAKGIGATEIHIVGGFNPYLPVEYYEGIFRTVKHEMPEITLKALTIPEIDYIARIHGLSIRELVSRLHEAGMDAHTGGGAEIFDPEVRKVVTTKEKISGEKWLEDAQIIHSMGIMGNSTITYGHVETFGNIIDHLVKLRDSQISQPGFLSIVPLKFSPDNTPLQKMGKVKMPASGELDLKVIAMARIIAGAYIRNISVYWVSIGKELAQVALNGGGSDLVGTAYSEKIFGATDRREVTTSEELDHLIREAGKIPAQRDTFYNIMRYS